MKKDKNQAMKLKRAMAEANASWPIKPVRISRKDWAAGGDPRMVNVFRSRYFLVQVIDEGNGVLRMSVNRTSRTKDGRRWEDGITWDQLQLLKRDCGFGDRDAIEIYPRDADLVDVANIRHLWILPEQHPLTWKKGRAEGNGMVIAPVAAAVAAAGEGA